MMMVMIIIASAHTCPSNEDIQGMYIVWSGYIYTERQKKFITSSGRRSLKSTLSKLIIFGHRYASILPNKNIWKTQDFLVLIRRKMWLNHGRSFFENRRNCSPRELWVSSTEAAYSELSMAIHSISIVGYVNAVRGITAFVCFELPAREASNFCDFWKLTSCDFIAFISSLLEVNFCFFKYVLIKDKFTYSVSKYDSFYVVDFSEWHSEEVISFFWCSVYITCMVNRYTWLCYQQGKL